MKNKIKIIFVCFICVLFCHLSFCIGSASALYIKDGGGDQTMVTDQHIQLNGLYRVLRECYTDGTSLVTKFDYSKGNNTSYYVNTLLPPAEIFQGKSKYNVPNQFLELDSIPCKNDSIVSSNTSKKGVLRFLKGIAPNGAKLELKHPNDHSEERTEYYTGLGYSAKTSGDKEIVEEKCLSVGYSYRDISRNSNSICFSLSKKKTKDKEYLEIVSIKDKDGEDTQLFEDSDDLVIFLDAYLDSQKVEGFGTNEGEICDVTLKVILDFQPKDANSINDTVVAGVACLNNNYSWVTFESMLETNFNKKDFFEILEEYGHFSEKVGFPESTKAKINIITNSVPENKGDIYEISSSSSSGYSQAYIYTGGQNNSWNDSSFDSTELYYIYIKYLKNYFDPVVDYTNCKDSDQGENDVPLVVAGDNGTKKIQYCLIDNYSAVKSNSKEVKLNMGTEMESTKISFTKLIKEIEKLAGHINVDRLPVLDMNSSSTGTVTGGSGSSSSEGESEPTCSNSGGAASLGWIVCPILNWLGSAADGIYSEYVEPSLTIEPQLFSRNPDTGTQKAWTIFQTIANTFFIILVLIVIFSQLTGYGIDNYGIKKLLPKLIVVAVLVNLSYLICLICVDISNILGNGFQELFDGLSTGTPTITVPKSNLTGRTIGSTAITGILVLVALVGMVGAVWNNPAILLSLLVSALGIAIAIFFLFILLSARAAAIIILTVISPVAFVCYALPNTKKLFDKWLKLGQGLLLVYPICGLLVGGGNYVSRLLLSSGFAAKDFISAFTAMIVGVIPIFFIPTVLKSSFSAMGNIGAKISGFGDRMRSGATKGIRNTDGFKNAQRMGAERRIRKKAGFNEKTGELNKRGRVKASFGGSKFGKAIGYGRLQASRVESAKKTASTNEAASASLITALSSADIAANGGKVVEYYSSMLNKAGQSGNVGDIKAAVAAMVGSGQMKEKDIADVLRKAINGNNIKIKNDGTMSNLFRELSAQYGGGFLATDAELKDFTAKGGINIKNGQKMQLGNYGDYAGSGNMDVTDIKKEDVTKLSGDSLAGLIKSRVIDQGMAQQMLEMNPNISNDKRLMLGAAASGLLPKEGMSMSAEDFKNAAKEVAQDTTQASKLVGMSEPMANAIIAPTPQSVNVVQNFQGGGRQIQPVDVDIKHNQGTQPTQQNPPSASTGYDEDTSTYD